MSSVVFILGAGASAQGGAPLMSNFLDVAEDLLRTGKAKDRSAHFERVFKAIDGLQVVHSKAQLNLNNIEAVFTVLELGRIIQRVPGITSAEIPQTIASLKEVIVNTLEQTMKFPTHGSQILAPEPYANFANLVEHLQGSAFPKQSVNVLTFNYDIAADMALFRVGLGPNYALGPPPQGVVEVPLLKLHGSLNWATLKAPPRAIRPLQLREYFSKYSISYFRPEDRGTTVLDLGSRLSEYVSKFTPEAIETEPVIVPPSWNKADYHNALSNVWAAAATHLSEAEYIFVIGYSLPETDSFFRHLYALGSVGKPLRKISVYNVEGPGEGVDKRFRALLGHAAEARYEYHSMTFENAIGAIRDLFEGRKK